MVVIKPISLNETFEMAGIKAEPTNYLFMAQKRPKLILGLRSLPGGNSQYLETMTAILEWIAEAENPTRENCLAWIEEPYSASRGILKDYLQLLIRLGMVTHSRPTGLQLNEFGQQVLGAAGEMRSELVAEQMLGHCLALP